MAIEPVTREERFLAAAGGRSVTTPTPITRKEQLLQGIIDAVKSGGATPDVIEGAVNDYLNANPVQPGATAEQAAQIEQNKTDIADLQAEIEDKQPKGDYVKTVNGNKPDATGNVVVATGGNGSGQNVNLTAAQVNALDGMFRVCAYVKGDVSPEYNAFRVAFGLDGSGGDAGGDEDMPGNNNTVLLSNVDTANPGEINIKMMKEAMPSLLAYGFNVETKETGLGGKHITGITVKCETAGTITIGKVDMSNYKAGVAPVMIGEKAFEIAAGMNELDVDFALSETETIGFQISTDTGAVAFGWDDDEIVDEMCIMPADQYRNGIKNRFRLYGSIYGGDI